VSVPTGGDTGGVAGAGGAPDDVLEPEEDDIAIAIAAPAPMSTMRRTAAATSLRDGLRFRSRPAAGTVGGGTSRAGCAAGGVSTAGSPLATGVSAAVGPCSTTVAGVSADVSAKVAAEVMIGTTGVGSVGGTTAGATVGGEDPGSAAVALSSTTTVAARALDQAAVRVWHAARTSAIRCAHDGWRSSGDFAIPLAIAASRSGGRSPRTSESLGGGSVTWAQSNATSLSLLNGGEPASISYSTQAAA
jgi:hypothetical protein